MVGGLSLTTLGLLVFAFAPSGFWFCAAVPFLALGAISGPMMAGYFSRAVREEEQGRLQGAWSSVNSVMGLVAPSLFTAILAGSASGWFGGLPGMTFVVAAGLIALAVAICARIGWIGQAKTD
jgi:DHA1 family tetracycline resistance protein-like MFS transporter